MIKIVIEYLDSTRFIKDSITKLRIYRVSSSTKLNYNFYFSYAADDWELYIKIIEIGKL